MDLNKVVQFDLGKYPLKLIFASIVLFFSIISLFGEKSHASEINQLPSDRNELTNIKSIKLLCEDDLIIVELDIDYIFDITLQQHIHFLRIEISDESSGIKYLVNSSILAKPPIIGKHTVLTFRSPIHGNVKVDLYRSKTLLKTENFVLKESGMLKSQFMTLASCDGRIALSRKCDFSNVGFRNDRINLFSFGQLQCSNPLLSSKNIFQHDYDIKCDHSTDQNMNQLIENNQNKSIVAVEVKSLIVLIPEYSPYDWEWMLKIASLTLFNIKNNPQDDEFEYLYVLSPPQNDKLKTYIQDVLKSDNVVLMNKSDFYFKQVQINHLLRNHDNMVIYRNRLIIDKDNTKNDYLVILLSKFSTFIVDNIEEIGKEISRIKNFEIKVVYIEDEDEFQMISLLNSAKIVLAPHSNALSQSFWMKSNSILIDIIPTGCECISFPSRPLAYSQENIKYYRIIFDGAEVNITNTLHYDIEEEDTCESNIINKLLNQTITIPIQPILDLVKLD